MLDVGDEQAELPSVSSVPMDSRFERITVVDLFDGPRRDLLADPSSLFDGLWEVGPDSNRVGVRLSRPDGAAEPPAVHRDDAGELASEGIAHVLVNGVFVVQDGEPQKGRHPGQPVRRTK